MPTFSFQNPLPTLAFTKPKALRIGVDIFETSTWAKVLEEAARAMLDGAPTRKAALAAAKRFPWMGRNGRGMARPCELEPGIWIELHQGSHGILVRTKMLLEACGFPLDRAALEYETSVLADPATNHESSNRTDECKGDGTKESSAKSGKNASVTHPPNVSGLLAPEPIQPTLPGLSPLQQGKAKKARMEPYTAYPKRKLFAALAEDRIPDEDFDRLLTLEGTHAILGMKPRHGTPVFSLTSQRYFWNDPATRRGQNVFVTAQWFERDKARLDRMLARWKDQPKGPSTKPDMKRFLDDILEHWPEGFDFSDGAVRLLEGRCGVLTGSMKRELKSAMFRRRDKLWFPMDAVASPAIRNGVIELAKKFFAEWGFFSTVVVANLLDVPDVRLRDDRDREDFLAFLLPANKGFFRLDQSLVQIVVPCKGTDSDCIQRAVDESDSVFTNYTQRIHRFIEGAGGSVPYDEIHAAFPNLDEDSLLELLADKDPDIIPEADDDGIFAGFKLLPEFYLPDDIGSTLLAILDQGEKAGKVLSASFINAELGAHYDCDFETDYALNPAYSLKWALEAVYRKLQKAPSRQWSGKGASARFVRTEDAERSSDTGDTGNTEALGQGQESKWQEKYRIVCERFPGLVNLSEYADFFVKEFGLRRFTAWAHIPYFFVRLDDDRAVTVESFKDKSSWSETDGVALEAALRNRLGNAPFLPLASIPESFFDQLPDISFEGKPLRWTHWLLEGIVWHFAPSIHRTNYGWQSFVATYVLPDSVVAADEPDFNSADYVLGIYCARNPHNRSVEAAFEFLHENHVRFRLRASLRKQIEEFLAQAEREGR